MNNNHGLTASNLLASLPQVLQDDEGMMALAKSVAAVLEKRKGEIRTIAIYPRIEELPEDLLDILAKDFKVDWWDKGYSLETKREILKTSWHTHRILGTKEAVTTALRALYDQFEVKEWWEYGGEPGFFKVETRSFQLICELDKFVATLSAVKRLTAHLEKVNVLADVYHTVGVGVAEQFAFVNSYIMREFDLNELLSWLVDEKGDILIDELGNILIE